MTGLSLANDSQEKGFEFVFRAFDGNDLFIGLVQYAADRVLGGIVEPFRNNLRQT